MVLSCFSRDLTSPSVEWLNTKCYQTDFTTFPGSSLAVTHTPEIYAPAFFNMLKMAIDLHQAEGVIIIEHQECEAYLAVYPELYTLSAPEQFEIHRNSFNKLAALILQVYSTLTVQMSYFADEFNIISVPYGTDNFSLETIPRKKSNDFFLLRSQFMYENGSM